MHNTQTTSVFGLIGGLVQWALLEPTTFADSVSSLSWLWLHMSNDGHCKQLIRDYLHRLNYKSSNTATEPLTDAPYCTRLQNSLPWRGWSHRIFLTSYIETTSASHRIWRITIPVSTFWSYMRNINWWTYCHSTSRSSSRDRWCYCDLPGTYESLWSEPPAVVVVSR